MADGSRFEHTPAAAGSPPAEAARLPGAAPPVARADTAPPVAEVRRPEPVPAQVPAATPTAPAKAPRRRRRVLRPLLFTLLPVALVVGSYEYVTGGQIMSSDNAYVRADMVGVSTDVSGIVTSISVRENQVVRAGDVLFTLDDLPFRLALTRAEAQLGIVRNDLEALQAGYRTMQEQIRQAEADLAYARTVFTRQQTLASSNYASRASFDQAQHDVATAEQRLAGYRQQLAGLAANLNGKPDDPVVEHPRYKDAVAAVDEAKRQLSHTMVRAPMDGVATNVPALQVGQYLASSTAAMSVVSTSHVWIEASPKETELTYVKPGQPVTVTVDTYPDQQWTGRVESISPASGSSFALLPAQNTTGNWVKVVQRIPMEVRLDPAPGRPPLRVGMSVEVNVDTGHARGLPTFVTDLLDRPAVKGFLARPEVRSVLDRVGLHHA